VRSADEQQAFDAVVSAYELVLKSYGGTESAASCQLHLAALYTYRGQPDEALEMLEEAARCYAGTPYNTRVVSTLGLHYLQGLRDPERAIPWLQKVEPPPGADENGAVPAAAYNEAHKLYLSAQESIARCETQLGKPELAEQRSEALGLRYPMHREYIMQAYQSGLESALSDPACRDLWPILRQWQAKGKKAE
jgi:tetratricopeptide (TPR) repeat protein